MLKAEKPGELYRDGEVIVQEGEDGNDMFLIQSGKVRVVKGKGDKEIVLATLGPRDFFGEMALFGERKRTATVVAVGDTYVLRLDAGLFLAKVRQEPTFALRIIETLVERLKEVNEKIQQMSIDLSHKNKENNL